jgi:CheY-like chemotaxis protein
MVEPPHVEGPVAISSDLQKIRLLAAEDNPTNQLVLKTLLHQVGIQPLLVANGLQAVEAWEAGDFDVILMDVQMPELDGLGATQVIRRKEAGSGRPRTPIIGLTANAMSHQVEQYLAIGMDSVVTKPIDIAKLFEALDAVI